MKHVFLYKFFFFISNVAFARFFFLFLIQTKLCTQLICGVTLMFIELLNWKTWFNLKRICERMMSNGFCGYEEWVSNVRYFFIFFFFFIGFVWTQNDFLIRRVFQKKKKKFYNLSLCLSMLNIISEKFCGIFQMDR